MVTWSWNGRLLSAGPVKVYAEKRLSVDGDGWGIRLKDVQKEDKGLYQCQINIKSSPITLSHNLHVMGKQLWQF